VLNRAFGAIAAAGGVLLLAKCAWHLLQGAKEWSQEYFAVLFGLALVIAGIVYLRAPLWGRSRQEDMPAQDHQVSGSVKVPPNNRWRDP
jgi:hypothetical protein